MKQYAIQARLVQHGDQKKASERNGIGRTRRIRRRPARPLSPWPVEGGTGRAGWGAVAPWSLVLRQLDDKVAPLSAALPERLAALFPAQRTTLGAALRAVTTLDDLMAWRDQATAACGAVAQEPLGFLVR
ncbi:MAG: DUF4351 domain-containing protein [Chloroflexales bacterium]|nr:DUF4351 domain-containing protein [Chloroflexales bacterium]